MGTKTIGLDEEAYERLSAEKREDESFSDVVKRITAVARTDWREGFGKYEDVGDRLERVARASRDRRGQGLAARQDAAITALAGEENGDTGTGVTGSEEIGDAEP